MRKLSLILVCIFVYVTLEAQYTDTLIQTPNGTSVEAKIFTSSDMTNSQKEDAKNFWLSCYNNRITYIAEATYKYNCHAFAWHVSEGGNQVWINTPNDDKYWEDYSYVEVSNTSEATKISFGGPCYQVWTTCNGTEYQNPCDHSATTTNVTDYFISKWGASPRFKHHKNDCPYSTEDLHYYIRLTISGPSTLYSQATYTIDNLPPGAAVQWSVTPSYIAPTIAVQDSGSVILTNHYGIDGESTHGTLQAVVTIGNQQITLTKDILFGWAIVSIGKSRLDMRPGEYILEANTTNDPNTSITSTWSVTGPSAALVDFPYPDDASYADKAGRLKVLEVYTPGYYTVCATANDGNYTTQPYCTDFYIDDYKPAGGMFSLSPNPVTTSVTITMDETKLLNSNIQRTVTNPKSGNWQIQLWSSFGLIKQVETDQTSYQLDLTGVPPGFYYVHVIKDGQTYRRQLVVQ